MRKLALGFALASTVLATPALAKDKAWYLEVDAGAIIVKDAAITAVSGDGNLTPIDPTLVADPATARIVALGLGDDSAVHQPIVTAGATLQALSPVHGKVTRTSDGGVQVIWTRRARGSWMWPDAVETALNEERELYQISYGDDSSPVRIWQVTAPVVNFTAADLADLSATGAPNRLQVRQLGRGLPSPPLSLALP